MSDKPTGVFVRLPVTDEQAEEMYRAYCAAYASSSLTTRGIATQAALLAIGTPVAGGELTRTGTIAWFEKDREPSLASYCPALFKAGDSVPVTSMPIAQAQIAALEVEVVRLREVIHKMIDMSRNAQTWSLNNRPANCRDELSAIGRLGEKALKGDAA